MDATVVEVGYGIAAVAFLALFVLTGLSKIQSRQRLILLIVAGVNFVWALAIACSALVALPAWLLLLVEVARIASWLVFTIDLLGLATAECDGTPAPEISRRGIAGSGGRLHPDAARARVLCWH